MKPLADLGAQWPTLSRLLDEALALPPDERTPWLAALPADTTGLHDTLARLLAAHAHAESKDLYRTLPALSGVAAAPGGDAPAAGDTVAGWRLLRLLGQGGMGAVWLAERADGSFKRAVALKLPHVVWGDALRQRLQRERDILATLVHPNIARLYDAGADAQGRPWLALEYVDGVPIDQYAREHALDIPARVRLLLQVCDAVAYSHSRLVVHRDLKPSNILVTPEGQVRLLDFGIAKLLAGEADEPGEASALTRDAGTALTPEYASPEQMMGQPLATTSDVYSLGVVAFVLLAGVPPYRLARGSHAELQRALQDAQVPPASRVATVPADAKALRGDLDAILNRALKQQPAERYASVEQLADDLRRHLAHEAVLARPDSFAYRARRFVRRHWLPVVAGNAVVLALGAGAGLALWQAQQARLEAATARAVQGFIESVFASNTGDQASPAAARNTTARQLLDRGAARIERDLADAPAAQLRLLGLMGTMYEDLGEIEPALALQQRRLALARQITPRDSDELILALSDTAHLLTMLNRLPDATKLLDEADAAVRRRPNADTRARARVSLRRALMLRIDQPDKGLVAAEQALTLMRTLPPSVELVMVLAAVGDNAQFARKPERTVAALTEGLALAESRPEWGASMTGSMLSVLGQAQAQLRRVDDAEATLRRAMEVEQRRGGETLRIAFAGMKLSMFLHDRGRLRDAAQAVAPFQAWAQGPQAPRTFQSAMMMATYGRSLLEWGAVDDGLPALEAAIASAEAVGTQPIEQAPLRVFRAQGLIHQGRFDEAQAAIQQAIDACAPVDPKYGRSFADPVWRQLQLARGQAREGLAQWQADRKRRGVSEWPAPGQGDGTGEWLAAAEWLLGTGQAEAAADWARQVADPAHKVGAMSLPQNRARAAGVVGRALLAQGRIAEARVALQQALALQQQIFDPERSLWIADTWLALAEAHARGGEAADAARARAAAQAIHARHARVGPQHLALR